MTIRRRLFLAALPVPSFWLAPIGALGQGPARKLGLAQLLKRVAEQAEIFRKTAPGILSEETLSQKSRDPAAGKYVTHEVTSVYGYGGLPEAPTVIHEIRKVISVDGKQVTSAAKARQSMEAGLKSGDDSLKKKLLVDFEKHGLRGAVTDFGQVILLFSARRQKDYEFEQGQETVIGMDRAMVLKYKQVGGTGGVTVFRGAGTEKKPLEGELTVRESDGIPLRVTMTAVHSSDEGDTKDTLQVDYVETALGCVAPTSVVHQEYFKTALLAENSFRYGPFRRIGDDTK